MTLKTFTLTAPLTLRSGVFKLTKDQLARRSHQMDAITEGKFKGLHRPNQAVQFKAGEKIEVDELPKVHWLSTEEGQAMIAERSVNEKKLAADDGDEVNEKKLAADDGDEVDKPGELTKAELMKLLDEAKVEYPKDAKKADLMKLAEKHLK